MFSSVGIGREPLELVGQRRAERREHRLDRHLVIAHAEDLRHAARVLETDRSRVRRGHHHRAHTVATERIDRDGEHERGIHAARKSQQHARKPVLGDVVANTHDQRLVDVVLEPRVERATHFPRHATIERNQRDRFMPAGQLLHDITPGIHHEGRAVEHQFVLSSDAIGIDERQPGFSGTGAHLLTPFSVLPSVVRRPVGHDNDLRARLPRLPRGARVPDILADQEAEHRAVDVDDARCAARFEIALLIEHRVVWKLLLAVGGRHATVGEHRERVVAFSIVPFGKADDDRRAADTGGERGEPAGAGSEKCRAQQQVFGRIAAERKLGRHDKSRASALGLPHRRQYRRTIAGEIPQHLIQLRDCDLHAMSIYTKNAEVSLIAV